MPCELGDEKQIQIAKYGVSNTGRLKTYIGEAYVNGMALPCNVFLNSLQFFSLKRAGRFLIKMNLTKQK